MVRAARAKNITSWNAPQGNKHQKDLISPVNFKEAEDASTPLEAEGQSKEDPKIFPESEEKVACKGIRVKKKKKKVLETTVKAYEQ